MEEHSGLELKRLNAHELSQAQLVYEITELLPNFGYGIMFLLNRDHAHDEKPKEVEEGVDLVYLGITCIERELL
jgi:hypothetical protein